MDDTRTLEAIEADDEIFVVVALIQQFKFDNVALALEQIDAFRGMTVVECRGSSGGYSDRSERSIEEPNGATQCRRVGEQGLVELAARLRLEIIVRGAAEARVVSQTIARVAHTGRSGDGLVSTARLSNVLRIRTMKEGADAI